MLMLLTKLNHSSDFFYQYTFFRMYRFISQILQNELVVHILMKSISHAEHKYCDSRFVGILFFAPKLEFDIVNGIL